MKIKLKDLQTTQSRAIKRLHNMSALFLSRAQSHPRPVKKTVTQCNQIANQRQSFVYNMIFILQIIVKQYYYLYYHH